ncbi:MAG: hypothetical protein AB1656_05360 [Candidatus Omnitrophota bacterium]
MEDNFRVYYMKEGQRKQIANIDLKADPKKWHEIEIIMKGAAITASLDGKQYMQVEDSSFSAAGMVGLWIKVDAAAAFDDFIIQEIKE